MKTIKMRKAYVVDGKPRKEGETFEVSDVWADMEVKANRATLVSEDVGATPTADKTPEKSTDAYFSDSGA